MVSRTKPFDVMSYSDGTILVRLSRAAVDAFRARWPASGLKSAPLRAHLHAGTLDLVDPEHWPVGEAAAALLADIRRAVRAVEAIGGEPKREPIPNTNEIKLYMHCARCLEEKPGDVTPMDWSRTQAGWTKIGLQVWCNRHDLNVLHVDFEGMTHPANTTATGRVSNG